jgi:hypothetical protein
MPSTITALDGGSNRREGVNLLLSSQEYDGFARIDSNTPDQLVIDGLANSNEFGTVGLPSPTLRFNESSVGIDSQGKTVTAPTHVIGNRTLGQSRRDTNSHVDVSKFDPVNYIQANDYELYTNIGSEQSLVNPLEELGVLSVFDSRRKIAMIGVDDSRSNYIRPTICNYALTNLGKMIPISQELQISDYPKCDFFLEAFFEDNLGIFQSYVNNDDIKGSASLDTNDSEETYSGLNDTEVSAVFEKNTGLYDASSVKRRNFISSTSGFVMFDRMNGTDSIAFADRRN